MQWNCRWTPNTNLCGPLDFMQSVRSALIERGVPARDIQYEVFGPDLWLADFQ
ncbi:MAG: Oxidoreductase FAD-binding domain protein [Arthrobacter sp.]|nr:Oxidoreductase FAD-binding domain protein [Arthrobacter sp.]